MNSAPLQAPTCPLCGGPNGCAAVAAGTFDVACWCSTVQFSPRLLALVPADQQRQACICRACAEATPAAAPPTSEPPCSTT
jgi:hypothetical protein